MIGFKDDGSRYLVPGSTLYELGTKYRKPDTKKNIPMLNDLIEAIKTGNLTSAKNVLSTNPQLAEGQTERGISVVLLACYYGKKDIAQIIADQKQALSIFEATALGRLDEVKRQLEEKPDQLNAFASDGFTLLGLACFFEHSVIVRYLLANGAKIDLSSNNDFQVAPIHSAAARKNVEIARILIDGGANINAQQMSGVTPLHSAAHNGDLAMVQLLLENGADVNAKTKEGQSPLQMAQEHNFTEVIQLLEGKK